jgi:hypothetical protein
MTKTKRQPKENSDDATRAEILTWVGAGPKRRGHWNLTSEQAKQFKQAERGIIRTNFHYTRWHIDEHGTIHWEETGERAYEEVERDQQARVQRALESFFATPPEPEFQIGEHFRILDADTGENLDRDFSADTVYTVKQWYNHRGPLSADDPHGHPDFDQESMNCIYCADGLPGLIREWEMIPAGRESDAA